MLHSRNSKKEKNMTRESSLPLIAYLLNLHWFYNILSNLCRVRISAISLFIRKTNFFSTPFLNDLRTGCSSSSLLQHKCITWDGTDGRILKCYFCSKRKHFRILPSKYKNGQNGRRLRSSSRLWLWIFEY